MLLTIVGASPRSRCCDGCWGGVAGWAGGVRCRRDARCVVGTSSRLTKSPPSRRRGTCTIRDERRILVIANETVAGTELREAIERTAAGHRAHVLVVTPALNTKLRHWVSDEDQARAAAQQRLRRSVAHSRSSASRPGSGGRCRSVAVDRGRAPDVRRDVMIISTHPEGRSNWLERGRGQRARAVRRADRARRRRLAGGRCALVARGFEPGVHQRVEDEVRECEREGRREREPVARANDAGSARWACSWASRERGWVRTSQLFQRFTRPRKTPALTSTSTPRTPAQPDIAPPAASHDRVHEVQRDEAEQHARPCERRELDFVQPERRDARGDRWTKSVTMYGAFGRKRSQSTSAGRSRARDVPRRYRS